METTPACPARYGGAYTANYLEGENSYHDLDFVLTKGLFRWGEGEGEGG